jgi:hypothetical protein
MAPSPATSYLAPGTFTSISTMTGPCTLGSIRERAAALAAARHGFLLEGDIAVGDDAIRPKVGG